MNGSLKRGENDSDIHEKLNDVTIWLGYANETGGEFEYYYYFDNLWR